MKMMLSDNNNCKLMLSSDFVFFICSLRFINKEKTRINDDNNNSTDNEIKRQRTKKGEIYRKSRSWWDCWTDKMKDNFLFDNRPFSLCSLLLLLSLFLHRYWNEGHFHLIFFSPFLMSVSRKFYSVLVIIRRSHSNST